MGIWSLPLENVWQVLLVVDKKKKKVFVRTKNLHSELQTHYECLNDVYFIQLWIFCFLFKLDHCFDIFVSKLCETIFTYYKSWAARYALALWFAPVLLKLFYLTISFFLFCVFGLWNSAVSYLIPHSFLPWIMGKSFLSNLWDSLHYLTLVRKEKRDEYGRRKNKRRRAIRW